MDLLKTLRISDHDEQKHPAALAATSTTDHQDSNVLQRIGGALGLKDSPPTVVPHTPQAETHVPTLLHKISGALDHSETSLPTPTPKDPTILDKVGDALGFKNTPPPITTPSGAVSLLAKVQGALGHTQTPPPPSPTLMDKMESAFIHEPTVPPTAEHHSLFGSSTPPPPKHHGLFEHKSPPTEHHGLFDHEPPAPKHEEGLIEKIKHALHKEEPKKDDGVMGKLNEALEEQHKLVRKKENELLGKGSYFSDVCELSP
jgi:hypothetical protein